MSEGLDPKPEVVYSRHRRKAQFLTGMRDAADETRADAEQAQKAADNSSYSEAIRADKQIEADEHNEDLKRWGPIISEMQGIYDNGIKNADRYYKENEVALNEQANTEAEAAGHPIDTGE